MVLLLDLMACLWKIQTFKEKFNNNWTFSATQSYFELFVDAARLLDPSLPKRRTNLVLALTKWYVS
jgi:hypothetical protein